MGESFGSLSTRRSRVYLGILLHQVIPYIWIDRFFQANTHTHTHTHTHTALHNHRYITSPLTYSIAIFHVKEFIGHTHNPGKVIILWNGHLGSSLPTIMMKMAINLARSAFTVRNS